MDAKPICYWVNQHDQVVPSDAGYVAVVNSRNITVEDLVLESNFQGVLVVNSTEVTVRSLEFTFPFVTCEVPIQFFATDNSIIDNVTIWQGPTIQSSVELQNSNYNNMTRNTVATQIDPTEATSAISLTNSSNNRIVDNVITNTTNGGYPIGIDLMDSHSNLIVGNAISTHAMSPEPMQIALGQSNGTAIYHNNFLDDNNQIFVLYSYGTQSDNGLEGNYWADYNGLDDGSGGRTAGDGIGDSLIPHRDADNYPLMEPWNAHRTFIPEKKSYVEKPERNLYTFSNSTLASLSLYRNYKRISLKATSGNSGFLNITVPRNWLDGPFEVRIDGETRGYVYGVDSDYSSLYMTYSSGTHSIEISGAELGYILGDIDGDGDVDIFDVVLLAGNYGAHALDEYDLVPTS